MAARIRKGYVDGPFGQIHYREAGEGPALVLLHQSPSSSEMFLEAYPRLAARGLRAIGLDTPGFGLSDLPDRLPSIGDYADALIAATRALGLGPVALLGHHTGASIAAEIAVRSPDLVTRLVLNGPPVLTAEERDHFRTALANAPRIGVEPDGSHLLDLWNRRVFFTPGWSNVRAMHRGVVQMLLAGETEWYGHHAAFAHDIAEPLARITQPTLILTNTGDDIYQPVQRARELRPDFAYLELEGGTHDIVDEQPEAWCEAVAGFVLTTPRPGSTRSQTAQAGFQNR
jgi:pimeloyl-ACP methyl ester carboxylesterase